MHPTSVFRTVYGKTNFGKMWKMSSQQQQKTYDSRSETNRKPKLDSLKQNKAITPRYLQYIAV